MRRTVFVFLAIISIFAIALIPSVLSSVTLLATGNNYNSLVVYCTNCDSGTCACSINNCNSGTLDFYNNSACFSVPYNEKIFSSGGFSFSISNQTYLRVFCDDGNTTPCTVANYYTSVTISGGPSCKQVNRVCSDYSPCCSGLTCKNNICVQTTTTTTSSTTTTTATQNACPYECCSNEQNYLDKPCGDGTACYSHTCVNTLTETSTTTPSPQISYSIYASVFVAILLLVFLIYFVYVSVLRPARAPFPVKK